MTIATKNIPAGYQPSGTLDLSENKWMVLALSLASIGIFVLVSGLLLVLLPSFRPAVEAMEFRVGAVELVLLGALLVLTITLHEAVHGVCFWLVTHERPTFGFMGLYAYAVAPGWYLPRNQYLLVALAPLMLISLGGLLLLLVLPVAALAAVLFVIVTNAASAIGDILVAAWLLRRPRLMLVHDAGTAVTLFQPSDAHG